MTQFFTTQDGTRLAYDLHGAGPALLCLPGLTRNRADFDYILPHLPARIIRMDYRGRGASDWTGAATYTVAQEARDALALLDHLGLPQVAILGTSRGGLIAMLLAALAKPRLTGICLNDIGPRIERAGLERIAAHVGRAPAVHDRTSFARRLAAASPAFSDVPASRWLTEAAHQTDIVSDGLRLTYDPALRDSFLAMLQAPEPDLWPLFDACAGLPLALIRGENTDLLSMDTVAQMQSRRPDLIFTNVPGRGHVPFLDEPESLAVLHRFLRALPS
jgi:pimeloyl-ACP methyl ester carboxylesterase